MLRTTAFITASLVFSACGATFEEEPEDPGRVVTTETEIEIIEAVRFAPDSAEIPATGGRMLDAIAQTLKANRDIRRLQVAASGASDELAMARAGAVIAALVARGVAAERLVAGVMDAQLGTDVEFVILERDPAEADGSGGVSCGGQ